MLYEMSNELVNPNNLAYHYCTLDNFKKIIETSTLRMTNISKSNDVLELKHALKIITQVLYHVCIQEAKEQHNHYLQNFVNQFDFDMYFDNLIEESNLSYYVACFSTNPDLLSQWRGYANNGNGVAIGFHTYYFQDFIDNKETNLAFGQIHYSEKELVDVTRKHFFQMLNQINQKENIAASDYENLFFNFASIAVYSSVFFKNQTFEAESEKRLVYYPFGNIRSLRKRPSSSNDLTNYRYFDRMIEHFEHFESYNNFCMSKPSFFVRENQLISYIDFSFEKIKKYFLSDIVLGPKTDINDNDLRLFLLSCGYDLNSLSIRQSVVPYRG